MDGGGGCAAVWVRCGEYDGGGAGDDAEGDVGRASAARARRGMFVAVGPLVAKMREVKDADEIAKIRAAARVGCELFEGMLSIWRRG